MPKFCDKCGHQLKNENAKFCDNCGSEIKTSQNQNNTNTNVPETFCPRCGQATPFGQTNCMNCGAPIQVEDNTLAVAVGYIITFLISILGLIPAIYLLTRNSGKAKTQGLWLIITIVIEILCNFIFNSVVGLIIAIILLIAGIVIWVSDTIIIE